MPYDTLVVRARTPDGRWAEDGGFWTYKLGLLLRALRTVLANEAAQWIVLAPEARQRVAALAEHALGLIRAVLREQPDGLEILTSPFLITRLPQPPAALYK